MHPKHQHHGIIPSCLLMAHRFMALITASLVLTNIPRSPLRPVLVHPGLVLKYHESAPDIIVPPLQPRPSAFSETRQPAAQHEAQNDANGHADEESSQYPLSAVAPFSNADNSLTLAE
ncbi:hypothetical protein FP744_10005110 [Trichoderma asperellum]